MSKNGRGGKKNKYLRVIRCPAHNCIIGRYDARKGLQNATFYCRKCGTEYTFTVAPKKF